MGGRPMGDKAKPEGFKTNRTVAPEGLAQRRATEDDDVEGHSFKLRSPSSRGE